MKNKILTISIIFITLSFIFISNVSFGATYNLNDYKNVVGSNRWVIVYSVDVDKIYLITTHCTFLGRDWEYRWIGSQSNTEFYAYMGSIVVYEFNEETEKFVSLGSKQHQTYSCGSNLEYIASNTDVLYPNTSTSTVVVFQQTPLPSKVVLKPTLMEMVELNLKTQIVQETLGTKLTTLTKVGLTIFGLLLVPFLIKFRN